MKKRCLVIAPRYPFPVVGGDRLRIYKVAEKLSNLGYTIDLACFCEYKNELAIPYDAQVFEKVHRVYLSPWRSYFNCMIGFFSKLPLQVSYYKSREFRQLISEIQSNYDVVVVHLVRMMPYAEPVSGKVILEMTDAISMNYARIKFKRFNFKKLVYLFEIPRLRWFETVCVDAADSVILVSSVDAEYISNKVVAKGKVRTLGNGVELHSSVCSKKSASKNIAFVGNMHSIQNRDAVEYFLDDIFPLVQKAVPNVKLKVIGRIPKRFRRRLERRSGVVVRGEVPSINEELYDCFVGVCPVQIAAGIQNKILEYMSNHLPVVSTSFGAEGLDHFGDKCMLVTDCATEFASNLELLYYNTKIREQLSQNANAILRQFYSWDVQLHSYDTGVIDNQT